MEPMTFIMAAIAAGALAGTEEVAGDAIKDAYSSFKEFIGRKFAGQKKLANALMSLEEDPKDEDLQNVLQKQLSQAGADKDPEVVAEAKKVADLVAEKSPQSFGDINIEVEKIKAHSHVVVEAVARGNATLKSKEITSEQGEVNLSFDTTKKV